MPECARPADGPRPSMTRRERLIALAKGLAVLAVLYVIVGGTLLYTHTKRQDKAPRPTLDDVPGCVHALRFEQADERAQAAALLEQELTSMIHRDELVAAAPDLALALGSEDARVRDLATRALLALGPEGVKATGRALNSPDSRTRTLAIRLLVQMRAAAEIAVVELVHAATHDADVGVRNEALQALCTIEGVSWEHLAPAGRTSVFAALKDGTPETRREALRLVVRLEARGAPLLGDKPGLVVPALLSSYFAERGALDGDGAKALRMISGEAGSAVAAALQAGDVGNRRDAARLLATFPALSRGAEEGLIRATRDVEETVREAAAQALKTAKPRTSECVPALLGLLRDSSARVQAAGISALDKRSLDDAAAAALVSALPNPNAAVRAFAAAALARIGPRRVLPEVVKSAGDHLSELIDALRDPEWSVRLQAVRAIGWGGVASDEAAAGLAGLLQDPDRAVRWAAAEGLTAIKPDAPELLRMLMEGAKAGDAPTRAQAIKALGKLVVASPACGPAMIRALRDPEPLVRAAAVAVLRSIPKENRRALVEEYGGTYADELRETGLAAQTAREFPPASDPLAKAQEKIRDPEFRRQAAALLGKISPATPESVQGLVQALDDEAAIVREQAAISLGALGPDARAAIHALEERQSDPSPAVREAVQKALARLK